VYRLLLAVLVCLGVASGSDNSSLLRGTGSDWLVRLASFVQWPEAQRNGPVVVGLVGNEEGDAKGGSLAAGSYPAAMEGRTRVLVVRRVSSIEEMRRCHIVLVGRSHLLHARELVKLLDGATTLTVSSLTGFSQMGGMAEIREEAGTRLFRLNADAARRSKLAFHPGLLSVATLARVETASE